MLCILSFSTSYFLLGSFVCGHGTFQPILQLHYRCWLILIRQSRGLPFTHTPNWNSCWFYPFHSLILLTFPVFVWLVDFFPFQGLKNSRWKHHMKKWWLRSYSRSGHVWISNSYPAGLSWKICPECSIFQWVSWLIVGLLSAHIFNAPVLSTGRQAEKAEETFLWWSSLFWGVTGKPASWS